MTYSLNLDSLARRAKVARWLLLAYAAIGVVIMPLTLLLGFGRGSLGVDYSTVAIAGVITGVVDLAILLGLAVAIPLWVYRARANLSAMGPSELRYSPTWSALSFFVPVIGLFVPFLAMRQIYNRSMGENEYQLDASVPDVTSWWACYVSGVLLETFLITVILFNLNGVVSIVTPPLANDILSIFDSLLLIGAALFLWRIVGAVTRAQQGFTGIAEAFA